MKSLTEETQDTMEVLDPKSMATRPVSSILEDVSIDSLVQQLLEGNNAFVESYLNTLSVKDRAIVTKQMEERIEIMISGKIYVPMWA